mgnify:CR=1 FL=1
MGDRRRPEPAEQVGRVVHTGAVLAVSHGSVVFDHHDEPRPRTRGRVHGSGIALVSVACVGLLQDRI